MKNPDYHFLVFATVSPLSGMPQGVCNKKGAVDLLVSGERKSSTGGPECPGFQHQLPEDGEKVRLWLFTLPAGGYHEVPIRKSWITILDALEEGQPLMNADDLKGWKRDGTPE